MSDEQCFIKKEIQQSQELKDFSQSVSRTLRVGEILRNTVNVLKETTNAGRIYICLKDKKSGEYQAVLQQPSVERPDLFR